MRNARIVASLLLVIVCWVNAGHACPFCSVISQTFSEEIKIMDVVAIAQLKSRPRSVVSDPSDPREEVPMSLFEITHVIKGKEHLQVGDTFRTLYLGMARADGPFLVMAADAPTLVWSAPLFLTDRAEDYLKELTQLSPGPERLAFFEQYLEDEDEMLAGDAYGEFARAPYADLVALKDRMQRQRLLGFLEHPEVPVHRRRLYFTMLGVCGAQEDAALLKQWISSGDQQLKSGLDAMLACYLMLEGEKGLDLVDTLFLANERAEFADTNAAIMALRFHGAEVDVISRQRLAQSLRYVLNVPQLADLVIPDLARWEDWSVISRLCELFIRADEDASFVRGPVIHYLRACPLPVAQDRIEELKLIDASAVEDALLSVSLAEAGAEAEAAAELPTRSVPTDSDVHLAGTVVPQPLPADTGGGAAAEASGDESRADRNTILFWLIGGLSIGLAIALAVVWRRPTTIR